MTEAPIDDRDIQNHQLVRYFHDCLAAQTDWARAINVIDQKDVLLVPLSASEQERFGAAGELRLTDPHAVELAKRFSIGGAEHSLFLGALFVVGSIRSRDKESEKRFCGPLLEVSLNLRTCPGGEIIVTPEETEFTVNYSLVGEMLEGPEDDLQDRLTDLAELVPDFPIDASEFDDFWNGFRMIAPEVPFTDELPKPRRGSERSDRIAELGLGSSDPAVSAESGGLALIDFFVPQIPREGAFRLMPATAIVLGKQAGRTMSALSELRAMETMPLHRTAFGAVFDPRGACSPDQKPPRRIYPDEVQPLPLTPTQASIVESSRSAPLTVVTGPPGTGKSYTITAIVLDALLNGQTVLVASQMDKAVEVVADQVETVAGPLSIARSGGRAAQRQLAKKIKRLTGPASGLGDVTDSTIEECARRHFELSKQLQQYEARFREIIEAERSWSRARQACDRCEPLLPCPAADIKPSQARKASRLYDRVEKNLSSKAGRLKQWWAAWDQWRIRRLLQVPSEHAESRRELESMLRFHQLRAEMQELEERLGKPFPANLVWRQIASLEDRRHEVATELLRLIRRLRMQQLVSNRENRAALRDLVTLLRRRKSEVKRRLQEELSAELLLESFPGWACTSRSLCEVLPASPGLFDLVVIDEASQCDLALASVALMRGKRAVVVGDPNQLRHVCFLSQAREQASFVRNEFNPEMQRRYHFRRSLFDVAADAVDQHHFFLLDEHFRSHPHIIQFSNRRFYEDRLRIMTARPSVEPQSAIQVKTVDGRREANSSINPREVEAVLQHVGSIMGSGNLNDVPSIGIVSPFRDQADRIRETLLREFSAELLAKHKLVVGTAHALQGDEKEIVILSTSVDAEAHPATLRFLESPNLFNVAITRARRELIVVTSMNREDLPPGLLREYLSYAENAWTFQNKSLPSTCPVQQRLAKLLSKENADFVENFRSAGSVVPAVVMRECNTLGILCDRHEESGISPWEELEAQRRLVRAAWSVARISHRTLDRDAAACCRLLREWSQPPT